MTSTCWNKAPALETPMTAPAKSPHTHRGVEDVVMLLTLKLQPKRIRHR